MPDYIYTKRVDEIARYMIDDMTVGMDGTSKKACVIGEIASGIQRIQDGQKKVFLAAAIAAKETNASVFTHTSCGTFGYDQVKLLTEQGIAPEKIVIGHMDLSCDINEMIRILDTGVTIGIDTIGKEMPPYCRQLLPSEKSSDGFRADAVKAIIEAGYIDQLVLSLDICRKEQLYICGGYGYQHLFITFLPMLKERGITEMQISGILRDNPKRLVYTAIWRRRLPNPSPFEDKLLGYHPEKVSIFMINEIEGNRISGIPSDDPEGILNRFAERYPEIVDFNQSVIDLIIL